MNIMAGDTKTGAPAHHALFYDNAEEYTRGIGAFVAEGLTAGEAVLVALPCADLDLIRDRIGGASGQVTFIDMTGPAANPARIIPAVRQFTRAHHGRSRAVGQCMWAGRTAAETREATRHESLVNRAFAGEPVAFLCPYHTGELSEDILADAARTHTHIQCRGQTRPSPGYDGAALAEVIAASALPGPPARAEALGFSSTGDLPSVRRHVRRHAARVRLPVERTEDLIVAANELATNTLFHGGGPGSCCIWRHAGTLACEVSGPGHVTDLLAGYRPPSASTGGGTGLWLVSQLCDLTEQRTGVGGTTTRLHMAIR